MAQGREQPLTDDLRVRDAEAQVHMESKFTISELEALKPSA